MPLELLNNTALWSGPVYLSLICQQSPIATDLRFASSREIHIDGVNQLKTQPQGVASFLALVYCDPLVVSDGRSLPDRCFSAVLAPFGSPAIRLLL